MLTLDINRNGRIILLTLPMNLNMLAGELRAIGIQEPLEQIHRSTYLLQPANELGEHFLRMVRSEDNLQDIALACREPEVLAGESRKALVDLIMGDRFRDLDHMADYLQYGSDALYGVMRLDYSDQSIVLPAPLRVMYERFGTDREMGEIRLAEARLQPVSEMGRQLIAAFQPYSDTIATANVACQFSQTPDLRASAESVLAAARNIQAPLPTETMSFYCPLFVRQYDPETEDYELAHSVYLARNEDEIRAALRAWTDGKGNTEFLDNDLQPKVASISWEIERFGGEVYGKAVCELRAPLTESEQAALAQWLSEDASDGLLENFGEYPIQTRDGDIYVSFFDYDSGCYMLPEDEFRAQVLEQSDAGQAFNGMGGMS